MSMAWPVNSMVARKAQQHQREQGGEQPCQHRSHVLDDGFLGFDQPGTHDDGGHGADKDQRKQVNEPVPGLTWMVLNIMNVKPVSTPPPSAINT